MANSPTRTRVSGDAHFGLFFGKKKRRKAIWTLVVGIALFAALVIGLYAFTEFDLEKLRIWIDGLSPFAVIPLAAFLPVVGFPVAVVYLVAGARVGPLWGGGVVGGGSAVHQ
jgi:uncharacterized membrane protein YdjX (TVP38/TMEM64 family)